MLSAQVKQIIQRIANVLDIDEHLSLKHLL
jgi:uncharacterized tellurite resistance protein B-like protein